MEDTIKRLEDRGIKPTAMRLLILKAMLNQTSAFSLYGLDEILDTVDKSTISRTITLFHKKGLIHSIDDGSGSIKYSVCNVECLCTLNDLHLHFHCNRCTNTFCLESINIPKIQYPQNFILQSVNFVLKGYCDKCSKYAA